MGSANVFEDLGLPNADELLVKADLAHAINARIKARGLTQVEAAAHTGLTQPEISKIGSMRTSGFSQERLQNALRLLGADLIIQYHNREDQSVGTIRVLELA